MCEGWMEGFYFSFLVSFIIGVVMEVMSVDVVVEVPRDVVLKALVDVGREFFENGQSIGNGIGFT